MAAAFDTILEENTIHYRLYPSLKQSVGKNVADYLSQYVYDALGKLAGHLSGYIWQKEPFNLRVVENAVYQGK